MLGLSSKRLDWRYAKAFFIIVGALALFILLFIWHLGSSPSGLSAHEAEAIKSSSSLHSIASDPVYAPHKLIQIGFHHFGLSSSFWMRFPSAMFAGLFIVCFYLLARKWFGDFIGTLATLFFVSIPWIILIGRSAGTDIMLLSPMLVIGGYTWLRSTKKRITLAWFALIIALVIAVYTPGGIWFVVLSLIAGYKPLKEAASKVSVAIAVVGIFVLIALLTPLAIGISSHPTVARSLLLAPNDWPSITDFVKSLAWSISALVYKMRVHVDFAVGRLSILNISQTVLALLGLYAMAKSARRETYGLIILLAVSVLASALNDNITLLSLCLPAVTILAAAGLRLLSMKWFKVFPLNPLPHTFSYVLICLLVLVNVAYGIRYSLAAWPHNNDTRKAYVIK